MLVVAKRDRLARDVVIAATIERAAEWVGATVVSADGVGVSDGHEAELLRRIVDAVAAYERGLIRGRTKAALAAKKRRGERTGSVPYGKQLCDDGVRLVNDEGEQAVITRIVDLAAVAQRLDPLCDTEHLGRVVKYATKKPTWDPVEVVVSGVAVEPWERACLRSGVPRPITAASSVPPLESDEWVDELMRWPTSLPGGCGQLGAQLLPLQAGHEPPAATLGIPRAEGLSNGDRGVCPDAS